MSETQKYSRDSFDRFGDDLITDLLRYVSLSDCFAFECVSKPFHRLVFSAQKNLDFESEGFADLRDKLQNETRFECALKKCSFITEIEYGFNTCERIINIITDNCSHLTSIALNGRLNNTSLKTWQLFGEKFGANLTRISLKNDLDFDNESLRTLFRLTLNLIECEISDINSLIFNADESAHVLTKLKKITAAFDEKSDFESLADIYSKRVETIVFSDVYANLHYFMTSDRLLDIFEQLSRFRSLEILRIDFNGWGHFEDIDTAFVLIEKNCRKLRELYLESDTTFFQPISHGFASLKRLTLIELNIERLNFNDLRCCTELTSLTLHFQNFIDSKYNYPLAHIHSHFPKLQRFELAINRCETSQLLESLALLKELYSIKVILIFKSLTDSELRKFIKQSQSIRKIDIYRVESISRETVDEFVWHAKGLPKCYNYGLRVRHVMKDDNEKDDKNEDKLEASIGVNEIRAIRDAMPKNIGIVIKHAKL